MPRLDLYSLGALELQLELGSAPVRIGRSSSCELCLNDPKVSRAQAEIRPEGDGFLLVNHSRFGTRLNAQLVVNSQPLAFGDRIYLGERFAIILVEQGAVTENRTMLPGI
jgi:pSer/pThr/pTyr-binding forkhead associated (FHA) protein